MLHKYRRWKKSEDKLLIALYNKFSNKELGKIFNRSFAKISRRAGMLGIKKDKKIMYLHLSQTLIRMSINKRENNPNWKGGRYKDSKGYIKIRKPEHPNSNGGGYIFEHRLVMEKVLGRFLNKSEDIHHINGNRADNRKENLELITNKSEHIKKYHLSVVKKNLSKSPTHIKYSTKKTIRIM